MAEAKHYQLPGEGFVSPSQNPDTLRIEIYWKNRAQWAQVAEAEPYKGMAEEAQRVLAKMMDAIKQPLPVRSTPTKDNKESEA